MTLTDVNHLTFRLLDDAAAFEDAIRTAETPQETAHIAKQLGQVIDVLRTTCVKARERFPKESR